MSTLKLTLYPNGVLKLQLNSNPESVVLLESEMIPDLIEGLTKALCEQGWLAQSNTELTSPKLIAEF